MSRADERLSRTLPILNSPKTTRQKRAGSSGDPSWMNLVRGVAAHELGNALMVISFARDRMREDGESEAHDLDEVRAVLDESAKLVGLLARLRTFGTPFVPLDLGLVVTEALPLLRRLANAWLHVSLPKKAIFVRAERPAIERALVELVLAVREAKGDRAALTVSTAAHGRALVAVQAATTGAGLEPLDAASLPHAFALATRLGGALAARRLANDVVQVELSLPSLTR